MKRTIRMMVEIELDFHEDASLERQADLASLLGNHGVEISSNTRALVINDEDVMGIGEEKVTYMGYVL